MVNDNYLHTQHGYNKHFNYFNTVHLKGGGRRQNTLENLFYQWEYRPNTHPSNETSILVLLSGKTAWTI